MRLFLLGDIALFGQCSMTDNPDWKTYFRELSEYLKTADYVVGNLETPFSLLKKPNGAKSAYLCSDVVNVEILRYLHINAVNLANNHMFDYGVEGYETTKKVLDEHMVEYFGGEGKDLLIDFEDSKLAFSGFCCYSTNPLGVVRYGKYGINELNYQVVHDHMKKYHDAGYLNIVSVHTGVEHVNFPDLTTISSARKLAEEIDYIFYGHHPHVSQGLEKIAGSLIAYSLGNLCFDDIYSSESTCPQVTLSENNRSSFILKIEIEANQIVSYDIEPIYIGKEKIVIGRGTTKDILTGYTNPLTTLEPETYSEMRLKLIDEYYSNRKSSRNLQWFLRRLRFRYIKLAVDMFINKYKYLRTIHGL